MRAMVRGAHFLTVAALSAVGAAPGAVDEGLLASYDLLRADCVNGSLPVRPGPLAARIGTPARLRALAEGERSLKKANQNPVRA